MKKDITSFQNKKFDKILLDQSQECIKKQTTSMSNLLKINFFNSQIFFMQAFRDSVQDIKTLTKKTFVSQNKLPIINQINRNILSFMRKIQQDIIQAKLQSGKGISQTQIQTDYIFEGYQQKIQELNDILILSQRLVQQAQQIKKKKLSDQYSISKIKGYKKMNEKRIIQKNISVRKILIQQMIKSIQIVFKVIQRLDEFNNNNSEIFFKKLLRYKKDNIGFKKFKQLEKINKIRQYKSQDKHIIINNQIDRKKNKQVNLAYILKSKTCQQYFKYALKMKILKMKQVNKELTQKNKLFQRALQQKNKILVLDNLRKQKHLTYQQKIMKLQLEAQLFYKNLDQKLLSIKLKKKSKQQPVYLNHKIIQIQQPKLKKTQSLKSNNNASQSKTISSLKQN